MNDPTVTFQDLEAAAEAGALVTPEAPVPNRTDVLYAEARERFESFCALDGEALPEIPVDALQLQLVRWQTRNFGAARDVEIALGIVEEMGEAYEASTADDGLDGLGDVMVYAGQLLMSNRLAIGPIIVAANEKLAETADYNDPVVGAGYLCYSVLKREQRIRGMDDAEEFRRALFAAIVEVIVATHDHVGDVFGEDAINAVGGLVGVYQLVGMRVLARDWKKDPAKGGEA